MQKSSAAKLHEVVEAILDAEQGCVDPTATKPRCTTCGAKLGSTKMVGSRCIHCG